MTDRHETQTPQIEALTPDEVAVAANAVEAHPDDVAGEELAVLAHLARHDPEAAQTMVNRYESDTALAAALRNAVSVEEAGAGQSVQQPPGEDGERSAGTPPRDALAGEPSQLGGFAEEVGRDRRRPEDVGCRARLLPGAWRAADGAILGGNPPPDAPLPPPLRRHPRVERSGEVGLVGGLSRDRRMVLIDCRMPHHLWVPEHSGQDGRKAPGHWEAVDEEIVAHEDAENTPHDNIDVKGYRRAHDEDGNAGTRRHLARSNTDPKVYSNVFRPYAEATRAAVAADNRRVHPQLDPRPYLDGGDAHLLPPSLVRDESRWPQPDSAAPPGADTEMAPTAPAPGAFLLGEQYRDAVEGRLLGSIATLTARREDGDFAVIDPRSGAILARGATRQRAEQAAAALARRLGRRRLQAALDQAIADAGKRGHG